MTTISTTNDVVTLINVFTVEPEHQQRLVDLLIAATDEVMCKLPGYVSANFHKGLDGRHVANYAQWRSRADFDAMLRNPAAQAHRAEAEKLAVAQPQLYQVVYTDTVE